MRPFFILVPLIALLSVGSITHARTDVDETQRKFEAKLADTKKGIYSQGKTTYFVVEKDVSKHIEQYKPVVLSEAAAGEFYTHLVNAAGKITEGYPWGPTLREAFIDKAANMRLEKAASFKTKIRKVHILPLRSRIVWAIESKELQKAIAKLKKTDWGQVRSRTFVDLISDPKRLLQLKKFYEEEGNALDAFRVYLRLTPQDTEKVNAYPNFGKDPVIAALLAIKNLKTNGVFSNVTNSKLENPRYGIFNCIARLTYKGLSPTVRCVKRLNTIKTRSPYFNDFAEIAFRISANVDLFEIQPKISNTGGYALRYVLKTGGGVYFANTYSEATNQHFKNAKLLYKSRDPSKYKNIMTLLLKSAAQSPRHGETWYYLGSLFFAMKKRYEAAACLRQAIFLQPNLLAARHSLSLIFDELGNRARATNLLRTILDRRYLKGVRIYGLSFVEIERTLLERGEAK